MKIKKILMIIGIISIILINRTIEVYAWVSKGTYEACNIINMCISDFLKFMVFIIAISFVILTIKYIKNSKTEQNQKAKKILKWLIITIIQIAILLIGAVGAIEIGMETYWTTGERYQINYIDGYISNAIRMGAFFFIIVYILKSIAYWFQSEEKNKQKIINLAKWQLITITLVVGLLIFATNW